MLICHHKSFLIVYQLVTCLGHPSLTFTTENQKLLKCKEYCCPVLKVTHFLNTFTNILNYPLVGTLECVGLQGNEPGDNKIQYKSLFSVKREKGYCKREPASMAGLPWAVYFQEREFCEAESLEMNSLKLCLNSQYLPSAIVHICKSEDHCSKSLLPKTLGKFLQCNIMGTTLVQILAHSLSSCSILDTLHNLSVLQFLPL